MKILSFTYIFLLLIISTSSFAQLEKANSYYDAKDYSKAIKLYADILQKSENTEALEKIANSYRLIKNYQQSELYFAKLMKLPNIAPINHLYYGMILKNNSKIDEAKEQLKLYSAAVPSDKIARLLIKSCDDIKGLAQKSKQFDVSLVPNVNTEQSDFAPVFFKNQLVFVSGRNIDLLNTNTNFLHVFSCEMTKGQDGKVEFSKKIKPFPWPINSDYYDGTVSFNAEQNTIYIAQVDIVHSKDTNFVNRSKLYTSTLVDNKWTKLKPFQYNSDDYSIAHPSISADGKRLFFASDKPGGQGGMDIYVCEKDGESWTFPKNLGDKLNTAGEEVFPYIRKDGVLFFSSTGHSGFGGLDVFSATESEDKFSNVKNLGEMINSPTDDFGIIFSDDNTTGYFSSDRSSGIGRDDIYSFSEGTKSMTMTGKLLQSKDIDDPLKNVEIALLSKEGKTLKASATDNKGFFKFDHLSPDETYLVKIDDSDILTMKNKKKYFLADSKGTIIQETGIDGIGGDMVFRTPLPGAVSEGRKFAGNILVGENSSKPLANTKVNLVDAQGKIIQTVVTNAFGAFVFTNLPADQNFLVSVDESDTKLAVNTKIVITNKDGKEIQSTTTGTKGGFKFSFLSTDKNTLKLMDVEDSELRVDFNGTFLGDNKTPIANSVVNLVNEKGEILQTTRTDKYGGFHFENLPSDQSILFALDENDPQLKKLKQLYLTNSKGDVVKEIKSVKGKFNFSILPSEKKSLEVVYVDDPWLKVLEMKTAPQKAVKENLTIIEKIYYNTGEYKVLPEAIKVLDKVVDIMDNDQQLVIEISSHTDSRSSKQYNLKLSQQRADAVVDYFLKNGIAKDRISGVGYGESRLINKCADGVECTEEEHAKNRRTEFKVSRREK